MTLRLAFMGTPDFAVPALTEIVAAGHDIAAVYTQPPRPAGRGQAPRLSPVHQQAQALNLPVRTPESLKDADQQTAFAALDLDVAVVVAYGQILPPEVLATPRLGCINAHASLLPRWRGAAPIQRAIMAGDTVTGVHIMQMEAGLDTGPILLSETTSIAATDTAGTLHDRLAPISAQLLPRALAALERGSLQATPQAAEGVTYARKIDKAEVRIDWTRPAAEVDRQIRGLAPFPGAWFDLDVERCRARVKVLGCRVEEPALRACAPGLTLDDALLIACGDGAVRLTQVQREGKRPQTAADFLCGVPAPAGIQVDAALAAAVSG